MTKEIDLARVLGVVLNAIAHTMPDDAFENLITSIEYQAGSMNAEEDRLLASYISKLRGEPYPGPSRPVLRAFGIIDGGRTD
jgi:hypothetical protein